MYNIISIIKFYSSVSVNIRKVFNLNTNILNSLAKDFKPRLEIDAIKDYTNESTESLLNKIRKTTVELLSALESISIFDLDNFEFDKVLNLWEPSLNDAKYDPSEKCLFFITIFEKKGVFPVQFSKKYEIFNQFSTIGSLDRKVKYPGVSLGIYMQINEISISEMIPYLKGIDGPNAILFCFITELCTIGNQQLEFKLSKHSFVLKDPSPKLNPLSDSWFSYMELYRLINLGVTLLPVLEQIQTYIDSDGFEPNLNKIMFYFDIILSINQSEIQFLDLSPRSFSYPEFKEFCTGFKLI